MKKIKKWLIIAGLIIVVFIGGAITYITQALPNVGAAPDLKFDYTPARIARGKYLANQVSMCMDCHSSHDSTRFAMPVDTMHLGSGGMKFDAAVGFPGQVFVPNITPYALKAWTDGELFRAITTGVKKDGSAIFPIMPWPYYGRMDRKDIYAIIAYIRSLKPVESNYPVRKLNFPLNIIVHTMPKPAKLSKLPDEKDTLVYGAYLVQAAACMECHSEDDKGTLVPGMEFAGGRKFMVNGGVVRSANITPDPTTGLGNWTKEQFVNRFMHYADPQYKPAAVVSGEFQTVMPWDMLGKMKKSDLEAIYAYLRTVKPIPNQVIKFDSK